MLCSIRLIGVSSCVNNTFQVNIRTSNGLVHVGISHFLHDNYSVNIEDLDDLIPMCHIWTTAFLNTFNCNINSDDDLGPICHMGIKEYSYYISIQTADDTVPM